MKVLFDAHRDGIFVQGVDGRTPADFARLGNQAGVVNFLEMQLDFRRQPQDDQEPDINGQLPIHRVLQLPSENVSLGTIKLMVEAHHASLTAADNRGCTALHLACRFGDLNIVKYLVGLSRGSPTVALDTADHDGNLPVHIACLRGKLDVVNYILEVSPHGVTVPNTEGKLPIMVLLYDADCARDQNYVDTVDSLVRANPKESLANLSQGLFTNIKESILVGSFCRESCV